ncbi:hypothetical protein [Rhodococcus sp. MEB041]|uniref:hypothetical protein n=1 Tax=Rhodococcus sp. MEB041 TaxID=3040323 RepID=UPI00254DC81D|nr:hypothetical protein [Rhodococcus sp. MEB041]
MTAPTRAAYRDPSSYELAILSGLQRQPHVYGGTVPPGVVADRRARNKRARAARRTARKA